MLIAWLAVPVVFWLAWLWLTRGRPLRHVATLHFLLYFFAIYSGAYQIYATNEFAHLDFIVSVIAYPLIALAGVLTTAVIFDGRLRLFSGPVPRRDATFSERRVVRVVTAVLLTALFIYALLLGPRIPLLALLLEGSEAGQVARFVATKGYNEGIGPVGPLVWISRILIDYFALFLLVYGYCRVRLGRSSYSRLIAQACLLGVVTIAFNERYPLVKLLVYFAVFVGFSIERPRLTPRSALWSCVLVVLLIPALAVIHMTVTHGPGALLTLENPVGRLFYEGWTLFVDRGTRGQVTGLYYIFDMVPEHYDFFAGTTISNPRGVLPYQAVNLPYLVCDWHLVSPAGVQCSDPTVFFGEVYANFGFPAAVLSMFVMGAILQVANRQLGAAVDRTGSPYYVALFAFAMTYLADFAIGFMAVHFDARLYLILLMYVAPRLRWRPSISSNVQIATPARHADPVSR
jgi:hypothetical protein